MTKIICNKILPGEFVLLSNLSLLPYKLIIEEKDAEGENMMGKRQSVPEQVAERLMQYAQDGWQSLFQNGAAMQEAVLADIIEFSRNSAYAQDHGFAGIRTKEEFLLFVCKEDDARKEEYSLAFLSRENKTYLDFEILPPLFKEQD